MATTKKTPVKKKTTVKKKTAPKKTETVVEQPVCCSSKKSFLAKLRSWFS